MRSGRAVTERWLPVIFAAVLALVAASAYVTWINAREIPDFTDRVTRTLEVKTDIQRVLADMVEAESHGRGYIINGEASLRDRAEEEVRNADRGLTILGDKTADNPRQQRRITDAESAWSRKVAQLRFYWERRRTGGFAAALNSGQPQGYSTRLMDDVRTALQAMEVEESRILQRREERTRDAQARAVMAFALATLTSLVLVTLLYGYVAHQFRAARQRLETEESYRIALEREIALKDKAQAAERALLNELSRSNRELQEFAFVASHDLQEPLRKIQQFGDRIRSRERAQLSDTGADYLDRMLAAADRMQGLIHSLLDFSRITTKAQPFVATDLNAVVRDAVEDLQARIERTGATVEIGPLPSLTGDPVQLRQLFQNLIGNALKFAKPGEPPRVEITAYPEDGQWRITVRDHGIGFDSKYAERIFAVFQRLHGRGEYEGNGIGLAIVRKIAERHGGTVRAESALGEGATFHVTLSANPHVKEPLIP